MCPSSYHQNGFVVTHALRHIDLMITYILCLFYFCEILALPCVTYDHFDHLYFYICYIYIYIYIYICCIYAIISIFDTQLNAIWGHCIGGALMISHKSDHTKLKFIS